MSCDLDALAKVPLFSLLDEEERALLASQVEVREFRARETVFRLGDLGGSGYVLMEGRVRVTIIDEDQQEVTLDELEAGGFFGFASLLEGTPHQATAVAEEACKCLVVDRADLRHLISSKPDAGMDMLAMFGRQFHNAQKLVQLRSLRNPNEYIDRNLTFGERIADRVASFGGSWRFIIIFAIFMVLYTSWNSVASNRAWDPYPFILLNLFLSLLAAIQAPVILMSQNRQNERDRLRSELDYEVNRRAESEVRGVSARLTRLTEKIDDLEHALQKRPRG